MVAYMGKIFVVDHAALADEKVFVVDHAALADEKVFVVDHAALADKKVFVVDHAALVYTIEGGDKQQGQAERTAPAPPLRAGVSDRREMNQAIIKQASARQRGGKRPRGGGGFSQFK